MKVALHGATGRMGRELVRLIGARPTLTLVGAAAAPGDPHLDRDLGEVAGVGHLGVAVSADVSAALRGAEVVIDFSAPEATTALAAVAAREGVALMSGTTGLPERATAALQRAGEVVPVLWAPNTSLGVQVLADLVRTAVARLGPEFDVEIVEVHHRRKVDAPSGTAARLAEAVRAARPGLRTVTGREGQVGARSPDELGVLALRGGDVIGDHTVHLFGAGERLELTHRATSRELFAAGALRAATWLVGRAPGVYTMADVLG